MQQWRVLEGEFLRYVETEDVIPFLKSGDAMVCDTSSILMEFLTQVRPVVTFRNRGSLPAPHLINVTETEQLEPAIERALSRPSELMTDIRSYAEAIHTVSRDGRSRATASWMRSSVSSPLTALRHSGESR